MAMWPVDVAMAQRGGRKAFGRKAPLRDILRSDRCVLNVSGAVHE